MTVKCPKSSCVCTCTVYLCLRLVDVNRTLAAGLQDLDSDMAKKKAEADRLRKAEKFMKIGTGEAECLACGYAYEPKKGDTEYPISPGTTFEVWAVWCCG